ncbi:MAG: aminotransferase class III-fold pyridoxal phosphate-dependent enzyme, partial [Xanthobacteraceae bacterium]|nr:aminotransferase class III-fold pyridoxal phosphate-dependent enzyme [Xanthobacteraceae bacterium]
TKTFFHSSSYTANPVACAAAAANLRLWNDAAVQETVSTIASLQETALAPFFEDTRFEKVRRCGTITALDLKTRETGYLAEVGPKLLAYFNSTDVLLRPLGNTIYVMPTYCTTPDELDRIYAVIDEAANSVI